MSQIVQIAGAILILVPFVLSQFRLIGQQAVSYLVPNLVGSAVLAIVALDGRQWGFVLLEGTWAVVSLWGVIGLARRRPPD